MLLRTPPQEPNGHRSIIAVAKSGALCTKSSTERSVPTTLIILFWMYFGYLVVKRYLSVTWIPDNEMLQEVHSLSIFNEGRSAAIDSYWKALFDCPKEKEKSFLKEWIAVREFHNPNHGGWSVTPPLSNDPWKLVMKLCQWNQASSR